MKNKKKFAFLTLAMTIGMVLGACNKTETSSVDKASSGPANTSSAGPVVTSSNVSSNSVAPSTSKPTSSSSVAPSSSKPSSSSSAAPSSAAPSSSTPVVNKYTVKFVVNGVEVQTGEVEEGQTAPYNGETPTKDGDANAIKYRFKGWDKDLTQPITQDTTFTAVFAEYVRAQEVDNFESYTSTSALGEAWTVQAYKNDAWGDTAASVSIGSKTTGGSKSLRFDGWENGTGFRFLKHFEANAFPKAANAVAFSMQIPSINTVKVILKGRATIAGQVQEPSFTYEFHPTTSEYVDYVIPLADDAWQLWGKAGDSIKSVANWTGIHEDDFVNYITDVGFFVQGSDGGSNLPYFAFVDTISFVTVDEPAQVIKNETMGAYTKYTGLLNDGHTVKVEIGEAGSATATIIDMETPMQIPGTVSMDADHNLRFASADGGSTLIYTASYKNGGQSLKFVSASGALAQGVIGVDLNAVQVVDNYEQYTTDGQAYYKDKPADQRSGCRGAYYSEYYAGEGNSSPWGGNKWSLLGGDGSQLKLKQDQAGAHSGKNYLCLKHSKTVAFRYMQWGLFDGTAEQNNFRGSKFSFWARTNGYVKQFKVAMYSQSKPTLQTAEQYVKVNTFQETAAVSGWKHYEIDLNPALTYYGFMITIEKNPELTANEAYLYIDDVEVYTANPYAEYVAPVTNGELKNGQVFFANIGGYTGATLTVKKDNAVTLSVQVFGAILDGTYTQEEDEINFDFGDALGTLKCRINAESNKLEYISATGGAASFGRIDFDEMDVLDNAESYTESGKMYYQSNKDVNNRSGARGAYYCDYYGGGNSSTVGGSGWDLMGGSGDQLSLDTTEAHSGSNSLKMKRNKSNSMRYMTWGLFDGSAEGHTGVNYFSYWVKNPNATALTIKTSVYYQATVTASTQQSNRAYVEAQIPANSDWTRVVIPLDSAKTYYGVAYVPATVSGGGAADFFYVDDAMFFSEEMNITAPFLAVEGLEMSGSLANGAPASITLGEQGKATLTCAALGGNLAVTFTLVGSTMTIKAPAINDGSGTTIVGTYAPTETDGVVAFTVTSCTGEMAAYLPANTVFQGTLA